MNLINGQKVLLRNLLVEDAPLFDKWVKDEEVIKYSLSKWQKKYNTSEIKNWLQNVIDDTNTLSLGIEIKETKSLIGYAGISNISKSNRSGEYYIFIGDKNSWGKVMAQRLHL